MEHLFSKRLGSLLSVDPLRELFGLGTGPVIRRIVLFAVAWSFARQFEASVLGFVCEITPLRLFSSYRQAALPPASVLFMFLDGAVLFTATAAALHLFRKPAIVFLTAAFLKILFYPVSASYWALASTGRMVGEAWELSEFYRILSTLLGWENIARHFLGSLVFLVALTIALRVVRSQGPSLFVAFLIHNLWHQAWYLLERLIGGYSLEHSIDTEGILNGVAQALLFAVIVTFALRLASARGDERSGDLQDRKESDVLVYAAMSLISLALVVNLLFRALVFGLPGPPSSEMMGAVFPVFQQELLRATVLAICSAWATVLSCRSLHRMWAAIQDGHARTTPGRAVGFLFVPIFGIFWFYRVFPGFVKDYNAYLARHSLDAPHLECRPFLAVAFLTTLLIVPFVNVLVALVYPGFVLIVMSRGYDALVALPASPPEHAGGP